MDKPRKPCVAALLSFFTIGLGHIYAGEAKKGIILYTLSLVGYLVMLAAPQTIKVNILILICFFFVALSYFVFCLFDAAKAARKKSASYSLRKFNKWYVYLLCFITANMIIQPVLTGGIKEQLVKAYKIPSGTMTPTLLIGDYIFVDRFVYKNNKPKRGDVVVFEFPKDPSSDFIKRVVAIGGDLVEIKDKKLFIDEVQQEENAAIHQDKSIFPESQGPRDNFGPVTVPENSVFVMGDNRDNSFDSRFWGFVDESKIKGKAISVYWSWELREPLCSLNRFTSIRWNRIGKEIE